MYVYIYTHKYSQSHYLNTPVLRQFNRILQYRVAHLQCAVDQKTNVI